MPKPLIIAATAAAAVIIVGAGAYASLTKDDSTAEKTGSPSASATPALVDPNGEYTLFSDPSVTLKPDTGVLFGNGQTLTFEYDGSKTNNDEYATLSYQLFYVQDDGMVQPMGGGNVEGKGKGTFTLSDSVFNSNAANRPGFLELTGTYDTGVDDSGQIKGSNVKLGMYSVTFDVAE